jgi:hypothetical protein
MRHQKNTPSNKIAKNKEGEEKEKKIVGISAVMTL